jgi:hypothetical protein
MKKTVILFLLLLSLFSVSSCWLETAKEIPNKQLIIVSDEFTKLDTLIAKKFAKKSKLRVQLLELSENEIMQRVKQAPFAANMDVLLIHSDQLRAFLSKKKCFQPIINTQLFAQLRSELQPNHTNWLPVYYNPLVFVQPKDSVGGCSPVNFENWHKTSVRKLVEINLSAINSDKTFLKQLKQIRQFSWMIKADRDYASRSVMPLSELVHTAQQADSTYDIVLSNCFYYLQTKRAMPLKSTSISSYRYGRNFEKSQAFIGHYFGWSASLAAEKNQLSAHKKSVQNKAINRLSIQ